VSGLKNRLLVLLRLPRRKRIYLISFLVLLLTAIFVGLDNPTGIILGWLAVTVLVVAMVREWRKPGYFFILFLVSFLGAILLAGIYMEVAHPLAQWMGGVNVGDSTGWRVFHVIVSNIILLGAPVGIFIGLMGFIIMSIWKIYEWRQHRNAGGT
jgi:MFS family permease